MATGQAFGKALPDGTYCPAIESNYGIHYKIPFVGQDWHVDWFSGSRSSYYYEEGTKQPVTWFDYSDKCAALAEARNYRYWSDFTSTYSILLNGSDSAIYESDIWKATYNEFLSDIQFLWGSPEEGGVFIIKSADDPTDIKSLKYFIGILWGLYTQERTDPNTGDTYSFYLLSVNLVGSLRHSLNRFKKVAWFVYNNTAYPDGEDVTNGYSYFSAFLAGEPDQWYTTSNVTSLRTELPEACTNNINYVGYDITISDIPVFEIMRPNNAWGWYGQTDNAEIDIFDWSPSLDEWEQISGIPSGGYELDPSSGGGFSGDGGGNGSPDVEGDEIIDESMEALNSLTCINSGLVTLYRPTPAELSSFAGFLYTGIDDTAAAQLKKLITNPLEYIIFVALCKFTPPISGEREEISFCGIGSGVTCDKISQQFYELDCGTLYFKEQFASFLDYSPNSKIKVYLPFCGCHEINCDDAVGSYIHIKYRIDLLSGCCVAKIIINRAARSTAPKDCRVNSIVYEFTGNIYLTMPLTATDWRGFYSSLVGLVGGVAGALTGGVGGAVALGGSVANSVMAQKVNVNRSGAIGSSYGYMGQNKPYIILERPIQSVPNSWGMFEGYTSNIYATIGDLKGYTEIDANTIWTKNIPCTDAEADEIRQLFNTGVYL